MIHGYLVINRINCCGYPEPNQKKENKTKTKAKTVIVIISISLWMVDKHVTDASFNKQHFTVSRFLLDIKLFHRLITVYKAIHN